MQLNFGIGIPTINRYDLLLPALHFYAKSDFTDTDIHVIDNGDQGITNNYGSKVHIYESKKENLSVAGSWNRLCQKIFANHDYALILNDDIYLGRKDYEIQMLLNQTNKEFYLSMFEWSVFIIHKRTFIKVGMFDEEFHPAYYEDNDYLYRMNLKNISPYKIPLLNPIIYKNSQSAERDPKVFTYANMNKVRYVSKWGGLQKDEKYKSPYNKK